ncbi:MAG: efflux RND transporter permease subunit [Gammaproteobacteria bacterium]
MIASIIQAALRNRLVVLAVAALLLAWGSYRATRMDVDVFPDLTAPAVTVVAEAHGMSPVEVENLVTLQLETALNGAPGVRRVRSISSVGLSVVTVEFEWGTAVPAARQIVAERLQTARGSLPAELPSPQMAPAASVMGEIMFIALTSATASGSDLKTTADWVVRKRLLAVPGVAEVLIIGGDERQYQVTLSPERLAAYAIPVGDVIAALAASNINTPAGFLRENGQEYLIQGIGRISRLADIGDTLVASREGRPVLVRHLGNVEIGVGPVRGTGAHNGRPAVVFAIQKQPGVNTLDLTRRLDETFAELQESLPDGIELQARVFRQADFIERAIDNLLMALRDGALLVLLIVFAFLLSIRATLVTLVALPLSLVVALLTLGALGDTLNTMTLGGLAIALGALVDDAIIVVENIVRRLRQNTQQDGHTRKTALQVVGEATEEIQGSIVFATLIILLVFVPVFFLSGVEGRLLVPLGLAYIVALGASLLVAVTVTPALALGVLARRVGAESAEPRLLTGLKRFYDWTLQPVVDRWWLPTGIAIVAFVAAGIVFLEAGRSFLPDFNEGSLTVNVTTLPGTELAESDRMANRVEQVLLSHPEVVSTARRTGRAPADPHAQEIHASEIEASLDLRGGDKESLLATLREEFATLSGMQVVIGQPISHRIDHMLSGTRANIAIKIMGPDLYELRRLGRQVEALAKDIRGAVDVALETQADIPFINVRFRRDAIARHGMHVADVAAAVEAALAGAEVTRVLEGLMSFDLVVRYDPSTRRSLEDIRSTLLVSPGGARIPLTALADVQRDRGPNLVSRENVQRKIVVMANVAERDLASVVQDIRSRVGANVELPTGYHIEYGGQFESAAEATRTLTIVGSLVTVGVYLLLCLAFRSPGDALLVMVNLPLALIGGVAGMVLAGNVVSVATLIGFITLFGIATRNGVMLVAHIRHLHEREGLRDAREAVMRGAQERLVPILMTALAAGLALVPLTLAMGQPGSEIQAPMAMVILCGLVTSTALNMYVVPSLYLRFGAIVTGGTRAGFPPLSR